MHIDIKEKCEETRARSSEDAVEWLISEYPISDSNYGVAFQLIPHRSWARRDQIRLAKYYLKKLPFANALPYQVFSSIMPIHRMLDVIEGYLPPSEEDIDLLVYHLMPVVEKRAKSVRDEEAIKKFQILLDSF